MTHIQLLFYFIIGLVVIGSKAVGENENYVWTTYSDSKCTNPIGQMHYNDWSYNCDPVSSCTQYWTSGQYYKLDCNQTLSRYVPNGWTAVYSDNQYPGDLGSQVPCQYPDQVYAGIPNTCIVFTTIMSDSHSMILSECVGDQNSLKIFYNSVNCSSENYDDFIITFNETCPLHESYLAYVQNSCGSAAEPLSSPTTEPIAANNPISLPIGSPIPSDTPNQNPVAADPDPPVGAPSATPQSGPVASNGPITSVPNSSPQFVPPTATEGPITLTNEAPTDSRNPSAAGSTPRSLTSAAKTAAISFLAIVSAIMSFM